MSNISIKPFSTHHWNAVSEIYSQALQNRNVTFETQVPAYDSWIKKFHPHLLWVAVDEQKIVAWAGLQPVSVRAAYEGVVEVATYVHNNWTGKGVGTMLMKHLIEQSEKAGIWTLYSSIFSENTASIRLHLNHGFREIGYREKIARLDGKWRNTVLFERRSKIVGI
jgi:L-amino acid N-acyltransferase YncA